jgi:hypothetical protein
MPSVLSPRNPWLLQFVVCCIALCRCAAAQPSTAVRTEEVVTTYLKEHGLEIKLSEGRLIGPATDWFRTEAAKAQFLFIGEEHDVREVPLITGALWRELVPLGYKHMAIEAGQWLGDRLDCFRDLAIGWHSHNSRLQPGLASQTTLFRPSRKRT